MYVDERIKKNANFGVFSHLRNELDTFCNKKEYSLTYFLISLTCLPDEVHVPAPSLIESDRLYAFCSFKKTR